MKLTSYFTKDSKTIAIALFEIELAQRTQRDRTREIAPILADYISCEKKAEIETKNYRISWLGEEKTLYLYKKDEAEPRLKAQEQNRSFEPIIEKNQPQLTNADVEYWQRFAIRLRQAIAQRKLEQKQKTKNRRR